jgi:HK97 family phage major capsid protein
MTLIEILAARKNAIHNARAILDKADAEKRELASDEREQYDRIWADVEKFKAEIAGATADQERRKQLDSAMSELERPIAKITPAQAVGTDGAAQAALSEITFSRRSGGYTSSGRRIREKFSVPLPKGSAIWERHQPQYRKELNAYLTTGRIGASLQTDISTAGGYMVLPEQFVSELLMDVDNLLWIRKLARTFTTSAQTLGVVKRTSRMASFSWGAELSTPLQDPSASAGTYGQSPYATGTTAGLAYGKRTLTPHYMTGEILASRDLLRSALLPVDQYIRYEIGRDSGELEELAFMTGSGAQQPLGLFTASADGIDTSRDFNNYNTATAIQADNLRYVKYSLKPQYRNHPSLRWLFSRIAINNISRLKDGVGNYLWKDGIAVGDPDSILSIPVTESEYCPSTFTTGQYVGMLAAFYYYWICDSLEMDLMMLVEKYAETNQISYIGRRKTDGMPQVAEAFCRIKTA